MIDACTIIAAVDASVAKRQASKRRMMRGVTRLLQTRYEIDRVFGGLDKAFHLRELRDEPAVMPPAVDRTPFRHAA